MDHVWFLFLAWTTEAAWPVAYRLWQWKTRFSQSYCLFERQAYAESVFCVELFWVIHFYLNLSKSGIVKIPGVRDSRQWFVELTRREIDFYISQIFLALLLCFRKKSTSKTIETWLATFVRTPLLIKLLMGAHTLQTIFLWF